MPYTPPAKLSDAEWDSADSLGANYQVYCPLVEGAGMPRDIVGNVVASPSSGVMMRGVGRPPDWVSGLNGTALAGRPLCKSLVFRNRGLISGTARTFFAVIRPRLSASPFPLDGVNLLGNDSAGSTGGGGIIIDNASGAYRLRLNSASSSVGPTTPVAIPNNVWQAVAVTIDDTPASGSRVRNFYQFNYADETSQTQSITNATTALSPPGAAHFTLFPGVQMGTTTLFGNDWIDVSVFGLASVAWDQAAFDAFRANPEKGSLGAYTPGGALAASSFQPSRRTTTQVSFTFARPTGGTKAYSAQLHRSDTPNFVPSDGGPTMVASGAFAGGQLVLTDTSPADWDGRAFYAPLWKDSAGSPATVVNNQRIASTKARRNELILGWIGDSISIVSPSNGPIGNPPQSAARWLGLRGYEVTLINRAVAGTSAYNATAGTSWQPSAIQPGTTLFDSALAAFQAEGVTHCGILLGTNDARLSTHSAATFKARMKNITDALEAAGITSIMFGPPLAVPSNTAFSSIAEDSLCSLPDLEVLKAYWGAILELASESGGTVEPGCDLIPVSMAALDAMSDGVHPANTMIEGFASSEADAIHGVLFPAAGASYADSSDVRSGVDRGDGTPGTLVVPAASAVLSGTTFDNGTAGNVVLPGAGNVRAGVTYGPSGGTTGSLAVPSLADTRVGVAVDGGTGTYDGSDRWSDPGAGNVRASTPYKANSATNNRTGTFVVPAEAQVEDGVGYGSDGTEFTGSLQGGGGGGSVELDEGTVSTASSSTAFVAAGEMLNPRSGSYRSPQFVLFQSGDLAGERRTIATHAVAGDAHTFTVADGFSATPQAGDAFVIG